MGAIRLRLLLRHLRQTGWRDALMAGPEAPATNRLARCFDGRTGTFDKPAGAML